MKLSFLLATAVLAAASSSVSNKQKKEPRRLSRGSKTKNCLKQGKFEKQCFTIENPN